MSYRERIVRPLGLITRPNRYGILPPGAMRRAQNAVLRSPGIIEQAPSTRSGATLPTANAVIHKLFPFRSTGFTFALHNNGGTWTAYVNTTACTTSPAFNTSLSYSDVGYTDVVSCRDRVMIASNTRPPFMLDTDAPLVAAQQLRPANLNQPVCFTSNSGSANPKAVPANSIVGYAVVFRRTYSDGYEIVSRPSPIVTYFNNGGSAQDPSVRVDCDQFFGLIAGDVAELYRTDILANPGTTELDPGVVLKMVKARTLTAGDLAAGFYTFTDSSVPGPLNVTFGKELYTNPGQRGSTGAHRAPDICKTLAVFKNHVFAGNITSRPQLIFQVPAIIGATGAGGGAFGYDTAYWRTNGIGIRRVDGVVTIGSPTITGISATHMLGLVVGQVYNGTGFGGAAFPANTEIQSIGAGTITMTANATASGTGILVDDQLEIGATKIRTGGNPKNLVAALALAAPSFEITTSSTALGDQDITASAANIRFVIEPGQANSGATFQVRATNGANYAPPIQDWSLGQATLPYQTTPNLIRWSNEGQPEHWPSPNEDFVGKGAIIAMESTRDALWIFCTDGLYRLSGAAGFWRVDPVDLTLVLAAPRASCVLKEAVYAYTNQGFVRITDSGIEYISESLIGDLLPGAEFVESTSIEVAANENEDEIALRVAATELYLYNARTNAWTTIAGFTDTSAMGYARYPSAGVPCLAIATAPAGAQPFWEYWNSTTSFFNFDLRFQPFYGDDPFTPKHWSDAFFVFDAVTAGRSVTPRWNDTLASASVTKAGGQYDEARAYFGVPRRAATGYALSVGLINGLGGATGPLKLFGFSVRGEVLRGSQVLHR